MLYRSVQGPDCLALPNDDGGEAEGRHKVLHVTVEAGGDATEVPEPSEAALDAIAFPVKPLVVAQLHLAVGARRDHGFGAASFQPIAQRVAVVAFVGDELLGWRHRVDAILGRRIIARVSGGYCEDERPSVTAWILVVRPPLLRPIAWARAPLLRHPPSGAS
jgi:hypothetical protein